MLSGLFKGDAGASEMEVCSRSVHRHMTLDALKESLGRHMDLRRSLTVDETNEQVFGMHTPKQ